MISNLFLNSTIKSLVAKIDKEENKKLFDEAVICLKNKALRSAYIMTWLCGAESLKSRIQKMAERDAGIGSKVAEIRKCEESGGSVDLLILNTSKSLDLISQDEYDNLNFIRTKRNSYAHPKSLDPSINEVIGALDQVTRYVLSKPVLLGYGYATETLRRIFEEEFLFDEVEEKIINFGSDFAKRIDPKIHRWIVTQVIERLENIWDDPYSSIFKKRGNLFLKGFIKEIVDLYSESEWDYVDVVLGNPKSASITLSDPEYWNLLNDHSKSIIINILSGTITKQTFYTSDSTLTRMPNPNEAFQSFHSLQQAGKLNEEESAKLDLALETADLQTVTQLQFPITQWVDKAIEAMKSHNWYIQNPAINIILNINPNEIAKLEINKQEELGRNILQCADGRANSAEFFLEKILDDTSIWPIDFVKGLVFECFFNERGEIRIKQYKLTQIVDILLALPKIKSVMVLSELVENMNSLLTNGSHFESEEFNLANIAISKELSDQSAKGIVIPQEIEVLFSKVIDILDKLNTGVST